jgi:hypothetical protein
MRIGEFNLMIRIEINGRDDFWREAVFVEWEHQYPHRTLIKEASGSFVIENDWLDDLKRIAGDCFSTIVVAPIDPSRRSWFRQFFPRES